MLSGALGGGGGGKNSMGGGGLTLNWLELGRGKWPIGMAIAIECNQLICNWS